MPNVKRIRQDQEAAQKRYATYADQIAAYNVQVDQVNSGNQQAVDLYNTQAKQFNSVWKDPQAYGIPSESLFGQINGVLDPETGKVYYESTRDNQINPGAWQEGYREMGWDEKLAYDRAMYEAYKDDPYGAVIFGNPDRPAAGGYVYSDWQTGTELRQGDPGYDAKLAEAQKAWDSEKSAYESGGVRYITGGVRQRIGARGTDTYPLQDGVGYLRVYATPKAIEQQAAPPQPEEPKGWNPSLREIAELRAPTVDAAGAQMATARGEGVKTGLVNEAVGRDSAFADPEDPNNLADKGILARVLGGQL